MAASLTARLRYAWDIVRGIAPAGRKASPYVWPVYNQRVPANQMDNILSYMQYGFDANPIIYAAIMYKWRALNSAPLRAYTGTLVQPVEAPPTHPLALLVAQPNALQSPVEFFGMIDVFLNVAGNAYAYIDRGTGGTDKTVPQSLWLLRPDRVYIVPEDKALKGYLYVPEGKTRANGIPIVPQDMIHWKMPNPRDPYEGLGYGLSPLAPTAAAGDIDNNISDFLKSLFETGTMLGGVLSFDTQLSDDQAGAARRRWQEIYGGSDNWGSVAVLDNAGKFTPLSPNLNELQFNEIDKRSAPRILGPLGVPGMLIGMQMENSTFSNYEQAEESFWQNTFIPELRLIESGLRKKLLVDGAFVQYDISRVPALQRRIPALIDAAQKLWQMGVPRATAFNAVGLNLPREEGDEVSYVPTSMMLAEEAGQDPEPPAATPPPADGAESDAQADNADDQQQDLAAPSLIVKKN
jgi:HK97 family phage portal protein